MRKFTTIFVAVVLCLAAFAVCASAAETNCDLGQHDWSAWITVDKNADGSLHQIRKCACGVEEPRDFHEECEEFEVVIPSVAPTCTESGLTEGKKCSICGAIHVEQEVIPALGHTEVAVLGTAATCTTSGVTDGVKCSVCDVVITAQDVIPALGHTEEVIPAVPATCLDAGLTEGKKCSVCGEIIVVQEVVEPIAHTVEHVAEATAICGSGENGNIEYWTCTVCGYAWLDEACTLNTNLLSVVVPVAEAHTVEHVEEKTVVCGDAENGNIEYWYCTTCGFAWLDEACTLNTNLLSVVVPVQAEHTVEHVEAKDPTLTENGNIEYWYCTVCGYAWLDAELTQNTNLKAVILCALSEEHTIEHVEAKDATCFELGNIEYWTCTVCGYAWLDEACTLNTNLQAVKLPLAHEVEHVEAKEATCTELGNIEYWYCTKCGYAWLDSFCTLNTNLQAVKLPLAHEIEHVAAKEATCFELGNIEYWYCTKCGYAWLDEACVLNTNLQAVKLPLAHKVEHVEALAPTATENGNIEYWYCTECGYAWLDSFCTLNTNLKAVVLPATGETPDQPLAPDTGDSAIFFIVAIVAVATLGVAAVSFKKREN